MRVVRAGIRAVSVYAFAWASEWQIRHLSTQSGSQAATSRRQHQFLSRNLGAHSAPRLVLTKNPLSLDLSIYSAIHVRSTGPERWTADCLRPSASMKQPHGRPHPCRGLNKVSAKDSSTEPNSDDAASDSVGSNIVVATPHRPRTDRNAETPSLGLTHALQRFGFNGTSRSPSISRPSASRSRLPTPDGRPIASVRLPPTPQRGSRAAPPAPAASLTNS